MGKQDIRPSVSPTGGHFRINNFPVGGATSRDTTDTSWKEGEVMTVDAAAGDINVAADGATDPAAATTFIAAGSSEGIINREAGPSGGTGDADGLMSAHYAITDGVEFSTRNAFNANDTNIGPAGSGVMTGVLVGVNVGFWRDDTNPGPVSGDVNGDFGINVAGTGLLITRIVDNQGADISVSGNAADRIFFQEVN